MHKKVQKIHPVYTCPFCKNDIISSKKTENICSEWKKKLVKHKPELTEIDHKQHPAGRVGTPEDISSMAAYLISDQASFITGSNFIIDGGMTKKMIYAD